MVGDSATRRLGDTVRRLRKAEGLTQKALGKAAGIDQSYISLIENHKRDGVTIPILTALAPALGTSAEELLRAAGYLPGAEEMVEGEAGMAQSLERRLLALLHSLPPEDQQEALEYLTWLHSRARRRAGVTPGRRAAQEHRSSLGEKLLALHSQQAC